MSIGSQRSEIERAFSSQPDIEIVAVLEEAFSAKAPGRPIFDRMLSRIEKGEAEGIIAWHPDRLARNSVDGGRIIFMLDQGTLKNLRFASFAFENNSQGKFMLSIIFGYSKYYVDNLSENVKRGNRAKLEAGWLPNKPPLGYLNDRATKTIVRDPDRFLIVRKMFDLALTGVYSPRRITEIARNELGLTTPTRDRIGGGLVALSTVYKMLNNPFYAGLISWKGEIYPGRHDPMLTMEEFERIQANLSETKKPHPQSRTFPFTGMILCGECGLLVTAEHKVNRHGSHYTYYHCTKRRIGERCRQRSVRDHILEEQILAFLQQISLDDGPYEWILEQAVDDHRSNASVIEAERARLSQLRSKLDQHHENLSHMRISALIGDEEFVREREKLGIEKAQIDGKLARLEAPGEAFEPLSSFFLFRNRAVEWFTHGDDTTKRLIFKMTGSNPTLKDKILSVQAKDPFYIGTKTATRTRLLADAERIRTLWLKRDPVFMQVLDTVHYLRGDHTTEPFHPSRERS